MARVAVDDSLSPVREHLTAQGFDVVGLRDGVPEGVVAIVVNGLDDDLMGRQDIVARVPVIDAAGRSPDQVGRDVAAKIPPGGC